MSLPHKGGAHCQRGVGEAQSYFKLTSLKKILTINCIYNLYIYISPIRFPLPKKGWTLSVFHTVQT